MLPSTMSSSNSESASEMDAAEAQHEHENDSNDSSYDDKTEMLRQTLLLEEEEDGSDGSDDENAGNVTISPDLLRALGGSDSSLPPFTDTPYDHHGRRDSMNSLPSDSMMMHHGGPAIRALRSTSLDDLGTIAHSPDAAPQIAIAPELLRTLRGIHRANSERSLSSTGSLDDDTNDYRPEPLRRSLHSENRPDSSLRASSQHGSFRRSFNRSTQHISSDQTDMSSDSIRSVRTIGSRVPRRNSRIQRSKSENVGKMRASLMSKKQSLLGSPRDLSPSQSERGRRSFMQPLSQGASRSQSDEILSIPSSRKQEQKHELDDEKGSPPSSSLKRVNSGKSRNHEQTEKKSHKHLGNSSSSRHHRHRRHKHRHRHRHEDSDSSPSRSKRTTMSRSKKHHKGTSDSSKSKLRNGKLKTDSEERSLIKILQFDPATEDNVRVMKSEESIIVWSSNEVTTGTEHHPAENEEPSPNQEPKHEVVAVPMERVSPIQKSSTGNQDKNNSNEKELGIDTVFDLKSNSKNPELTPSKHGTSKRKKQLTKLLLPWRKKHHELMDGSVSSFDYDHDPANS